MHQKISGATMPGKLHLPARIVMLPADVQLSDGWSFWALLQPTQHKIWRTADAHAVLPAGAIDIPRLFAPNAQALRAQIDAQKESLTQMSSAVAAATESLVALCVEYGFGNAPLQLSGIRADASFDAFREAVLRANGIACEEGGPCFELCDREGALAPALTTLYEALRAQKEVGELVRRLLPLSVSPRWKRRDFRFYNDVDPDLVWQAYGTSDYLWQAPVPLSLRQASAAGALRMDATELFASVCFTGWFWAYETGLVSRGLRIHGHVSSEAEAKERAMEAVRTAWSQRRDAIRVARGGYLSWGLPIELPVQEPVVRPSPPMPIAPDELPLSIEKRLAVGPCVLSASLRIQSGQHRGRRVSDAIVLRRTADGVVTLQGGKESLFGSVSDLCERIRYNQVTVLAIDPVPSVLALEEVPPAEVPPAEDGIAAELFAGANLG